MRNRVYIFWDNSNIFIPAKYVANGREGGFAEQQIRIHFQNLYELARAGREVISGVCVGSVPPDLRRVWDRLRTTGVSLELFERGQETGQEQGVDQCLQVHMLRALADVKPAASAVLLTGDGAGYVTGVGFHADLERLANAGWGVEVISWDIACNNALREWAKSIGIYVPLEDYYEAVTFLEGGRRVGTLSLKRRGLAEPAAGKD